MERRVTRGPCVKSVGPTVHFSWFDGHRASASGRVPDERELSGEIWEPVCEERCEAEWDREQRTEIHTVLRR